MEIICLEVVIMDRSSYIKHIIALLLAMALLPSCVQETSYKALRKARGVMEHCSLDSSVHKYLDDVLQEAGR